MKEIARKTKVEFIGFTIYENGKSRELSLDELTEFEKQGYIIEVRLIKPKIIKELSINFEIIEELSVDDKKTIDK